MAATKFGTTLFLLLFAVTAAVSGQEPHADTTRPAGENGAPPGLFKNGIYVAGGTFGSVYGFINGSYERMLWGNRNPLARSFFIRASIGSLKGEGITGLFISSDIKVTTYMGILGMLIGTKSSLLELGAGAVYMVGTETTYGWWSGTRVTRDVNDMAPALTVGYRYQKPGDNFIFRAGIGFPEIYYLSLGFCF